MTPPDDAPVVASGPDGAVPVASALDEDPRNRFYRGTIMRLQPGSRTGVVRTGSGRDVPFALADIRLLGTDGGFSSLREGMEIGFDLDWTSHGVRVTTIRVFA